MIITKSLPRIFKCFYPLINITVCFVFTQNAIKADNKIMSAKLTKRYQKLYKLSHLELKCLQIQLLLCVVFGAVRVKIFLTCLSYVFTGIRQLLL